MIAHPETQTDTRDPPLRRFLTYRLSRVQSKLNAQAYALLQQHAGLTLAKWRILSLIGDAGQTRLSDIARATALDKGLLSRNLKSLITEGLVIAKGDALDHRVQHLALTPTGTELFKRTLPKMQQRQRTLEQALTHEELNALDTALEKLEAAAAWREETA